MFLSFEFICWHKYIIYIDYDYVYGRHRIITLHSECKLPFFHHRKNNLTKPRTRDREREKKERKKKRERKQKKKEIKEKNREIEIEIDR